MDEWGKVYSNALKVIDKFGRECLLYRGHCQAEWPLMPGLGRLECDSAHVLECEQIAYFDFVTRAGDLLPATSDSWNNLFAMQHYGFPTRLLDWSETFGVALYFSLRGSEEDAAVWILDPFGLNSITINREEMIHPTELNGNYQDYFISRTKKIEGSVVAISPLRHNPRVFHQRAGFTLHDNLNTPLEALYSSVVHKILIPASARAGAEKFLKLAGISEFSLFPDLDGLARELKTELFGRIGQRAMKERVVPSSQRQKKTPAPAVAPGANRTRRARPLSRRKSRTR